MSTIKALVDVVSGEGPLVFSYGGEQTEEALWGLFL